MPKTYTRLTEDERYQIYEDKFTGFSHRQIDQRLNRHHNTISRDIFRKPIDPDRLSNVLPIIK